ncbi:MAG: hypothetical protein AAFP70_00570 [Calditrichota bacterium]
MPRFAKSKLLLIEILTIVFAVMLAFLAEDWRENRKTQRSVQLSVGAIKQELQTGLASLKDAHEFQNITMGMIQDFSKANKDNPKPDFQQLYISLYSRKGGMWKPAELHRAAWKTAEASGLLKNMDYDTVLMLSKVYGTVDEYHANRQSFSDIQTLIGFQDITNEQFINGFAANLNSIWWLEKRLIRVYEEALQHLNSQR